MTEVIRDWKCRKPQKQSKLKTIEGSYVKLTYAISDTLAGPLKVVLEESGAVYKTGKAPRGWLERRAGKLMHRMGK